VEFRSGYTYEYRAVPEEAQATARERHAQMEHCKKLLQDLPIALQNSVAAMDAHSESEDVDMNTLGAMVLEQKRIKQEIQTQAMRGEELEALVQVDCNAKNLMATSQFQTSLVLPFGVTRLGGRECTICLLPTNQNPAPPQASTIMLEPLQLAEQERGGEERKAAN
jgi:hypothetical protein